MIGIVGRALVQSARYVLAFASLWLVLSISPPTASPAFAEDASNMCVQQTQACGCATCGCCGGACDGGGRPSCPPGSRLYDDYCLPDCPGDYVRYPGIPGLCMPPCQHGCPEGYDQVPLPECPDYHVRDLRNPENCIPDYDRLRNNDNCAEGMSYSSQTGRCEFDCPRRLLPQWPRANANSPMRVNAAKATPAICAPANVCRRATGLTLMTGSACQLVRRAPIATFSIRRAACRRPRCVKMASQWKMAAACPSANRVPCVTVTATVYRRPARTELIPNLRGECRQPVCPDGWSRNEQGNCAPPEDVCEDGTVEVRGQCVPVCGPNEERDENGRCVPVDEGCGQGEEELDGQCVPICKQGLRRDANGRCVPERQGCPKGTEAYKGRCVDICKQGTRRNADGRCVTIERKCPEGSVRTKDGNCFRLPTQVICPKGYRPDGQGGCTRIVTLIPQGCPDNTVYNKRTKKCERIRRARPQPRP
jgi:hypothetical protein